MKTTLLLLPLLAGLFQLLTLACLLLLEVGDTALMLLRQCRDDPLERSGIVRQRLKEGIVHDAHAHFSAGAGTVRTGRADQEGIFASFR